MYSVDSLGIHSVIALLSPNTSEYELHESNLQSRNKMPGNLWIRMGVVVMILLAAPYNFPGTYESTLN